MLRAPPTRSPRRHLVRAIGALHVIALIALAPSVAMAAPKEPAGRTHDDAAVDEAAKARYAEGLRLYGKKRYEEARAAFIQSKALKRRPAATLMLARSSLKAGRWLEAVRTFDAYVAEVGAVPPRLQSIVDNGRREARTHLGTMRFDVPEGAEVSLDGERLASIETPIDVMPGPHMVDVTHRGETKTEMVEAQPGSTVEVKPTFVPKALVPAPDTRTRPTPPPPPPEPTAEAQHPESPSILSAPATTWPMYVSGAVGLGGLAAAAIFGGLKANASHAVDVSSEAIVREQKSPADCARGIPGPEGDPNRYSDTCLTLRRNQQIASMHQRAFTTSLVVGLSGTAIAVGWFLLAPKESGKKASSTGSAEDLTPRVVPWVGVNNGGATFEGRF